MKRIVLFTLSLCIFSVFSAQANQTRVVNNVTTNTVNTVTTVTTVNTVNTVVINTGDLEFDQFLFRLDTTVSTRINIYIRDLHTVFNVPVKRLKRLINKQNMSPADVLLVLQLAKMTGAPLKKILKRYKQHRPKGWQAIFRSFDIYPGSRFFIILYQEVPTVIIRYVEQGSKGSRKRKGSKRKGSKRKGSKGKK
ncbi:MAG: hypothetical protein GY795_03340 [Desulfobacterales bacterium]|nr:hypothetical protein [Desulfobacterales bacterium]